MNFGEIEVADPRAKAERSRTKDLKQGILEQKESVVSSKPRSKNKAPWALYLMDDLSNKGYLLARGKTKSDLYKALDKYKRVHTSPTHSPKFYFEGPEGRTEPQSVFNYVLQR